MRSFVLVRSVSCQTCAYGARGNIFSRPEGPHYFSAAQQVSKKSSHHTEQICVMLTTPLMACMLPVRDEQHDHR